jgi:hypothetical protein
MTATLTLMYWYSPVYGNVNRYEYPGHGKKTGDSIFCLEDLLYLFAYIML